MTSTRHASPLARHVREALRLLESRGAVEVRQGAAGGAFVRKPQPADLDEHQDIIDALRAGNANLACNRMRTHVHTSAHSWAKTARVASATPRN